MLRDVGPSGLATPSQPDGSRSVPRYLPIAEHGLIGDLHTVALVGTDGTIDWYCCPISCRAQGSDARRVEVGGPSSDVRPGWATCGGEARNRECGRGWILRV